MWGCPLLFWVVLEVGDELLGAAAVLAVELAVGIHPVERGVFVFAYAETSFEGLSCEDRWE